MTSKNLFKVWYEENGSSFEDDSNLSIGAIAGKLYDGLQPALLPGEDLPKNRIIAFNKSKGLWENDYRSIRRMADIMRPGIGNSDFNSILGIIESRAHADDSILKPYNGSRYLLFLNGVYDALEGVMHDLDESFVKDLYFTNRHQININYDSDYSDIVIKNGATFGGDWSIKQFLMAYADNNEDNYQLLLFGLALGLFAGHNSGVHFDIQGSSGWGKSTLSNIYRGLFDDRVVQIPFSALNGRFPFNNYHQNNSVIWLSENNVGSEPLNDTFGTIHYDNLADIKARFEVKGKGDVMLEDPPQVFIDGTQLVKAENMQTGPARRTIAFVLPRLTEDLRKQLYGLDIEVYLAREDILNFIVNEALKAFTTIVPHNRINNFKMNLALSADVDLLPEIAKEWRIGIVENVSDLEPWLDEYVFPYITYGDKLDENGNLIENSLMHNKFLHRLYLDDYVQKNPQDSFGNHALSYDKFNKELKTAYDSHNLIMKPIGTQTNGRKPRKLVSTLNKIKWNTQAFNSDHAFPNDFTNATSAFYKSFWNKQITGWYELEENPI